MIEKLYQIYLAHPCICTDTRNISPDSLFFCLKGENFDGNQFALNALEQGAAYTVTQRADLSGHDRCIVVDDTLATLQKLAIHHRKQLHIPFIGITGTNGKTTTKELTATVLQTRYKTAFTQGNFNNHIGVPLTLLSIPKDTEIAIIEMGANHVGEIADLCRISQPTHGMITNIGKAHLGGFGSVENIIATKRALYDSVIASEGTLFVNGGDELLSHCAGEYSKQVRYGDCADSICNGSVTGMDPYLTIRTDAVTFRTHLTGDYNLCNILGAIAVGKHFGISEEDASRAIANYIPANHRSQIATAGSNTIIADYYNANPTSMTAALHNLIRLPHPNKQAILGDMLELGDISEEEHRKIMEICQTNGIHALFVGSIFESLHFPGAIVFPDVSQLNEYLKSHPINHAMVLVKGSRGIHLEKTEITPKP